MRELGLYLFDVINKGYEVDFHKSPFHPNTMAVHVSLGRWHVEHIVEKTDVFYDELLLTIIKTMVEEIEERIKVRMNELMSDVLLEKKPTTELEVYLMTLIEKGYEVRVCKLNSYPEMWSVEVSSNQYHIETKVNIDCMERDETLISVIKTLVDEIEERIKKSE